MAQNIEQITGDELTEATSVNEDDYTLAVGATYDKKLKIRTLVDFILSAKPVAALTTTAKTIVGAINELNSKLEYHKTATSFSNIGGNDTTGHIFALPAFVMGTRNTDGVWTVYINGKISTNSGATGDMFAYGIRLSHLKSALGATGTLNFIGGNFTTYKSDGTIASYDNQGYAGAFASNGDILRFGRFYKIDGSYGQWAANSSIVSVNNLVYATIILQEI